MLLAPTSRTSQKRPTKLKPKLSMRRQSVFQQGPYKEAWDSQCKHLESCCWEQAVPQPSTLLQQQPAALGRQEGGDTSPAQPTQPPPGAEAGISRANVTEQCLICPTTTLLHCLWNLHKFSGCKHQVEELLYTTGSFAVHLYLNFESFIWTSFLPQSFSLFASAVFQKSKTFCKKDFNFNFLNWSDQ